MIAAVLCASVALQSAGEDLSDFERSVLDRFRDLPEAEQRDVVERAWLRIAEEDHPLCRAVGRVLNHPRVRDAERLDPDPHRAHDADRWAPALELETRVVPRGTLRWQAVQRRFFQSVPLPDRGASWEWDAGRNALVRPQQPRPPREQLLALLRGRWPDDGYLQACVAGALDHDDDQDAVADYFAHHYRDREGRVYEEVRLYDVWNSGVEFEVSDVEAIAWLRKIADEHRLQSPIPGRLHDRIYRRIEQSFVPYRDARRLREALATRALTPWAEPPPAWRGVRDRLDWAWTLADHDPRAMIAMLDAHPTRGDFLGAAAARVHALREDPDSAAAWEGALAKRDTLDEHLAAFAREYVREQGLLGFRMR